MYLWFLFIAVFVFLFLFLAMPIYGIIKRALFPVDGLWMPEILIALMQSPSLWNSVINSLIMGLFAVIFSALIALPLAVLNTRYQYPFKRLLTGLTLFPLILPPFVGAVGLLRAFGKYGLVNHIFNMVPFDWLTESGLYGVAFVQALHLYPILYLNLTSALSNTDQELVNAASLSGASRFRSFLDITVPLAMPGIASGAVVVFLWSFTDIGTPLVMGFRSVVASEIFDRTSSVNNDPSGSALVLFVLIFTVALILPIKRYLKGETAGSGSKGIKGHSEIIVKRKFLLSVIYLAYLLLAIITLIPHVALTITAFAGEWFLTALPSAWTFNNFGMLAEELGVIGAVRNSVIYSAASTVVDILIGFGLAYAVSRKKLPFAQFWDALVMLPLVLPGLVLAYGYIAIFSGTLLDPLHNPIPLLVIGYSIRRLPFVFRSSYASLEQLGVSYEDAARMSGAGRIRSIFDVVLPLSAAGLVGGAILAFLFAMLEVSESLILAVKENYFPITRMLYALMAKIPDGEYVAAALGVICMVGMAAGLVVASTILGKQMGRLFRS